jgi:hypothetical protein
VVLNTAVASANTVAATSSKEVRILMINLLLHLLSWITGYEQAWCQVTGMNGRVNFGIQKDSLSRGAINCVRVWT